MEQIYLITISGFDDLDEKSIFDKFEKISQAVLEEKNITVECIDEYDYIFFICTEDKLKLFCDILEGLEYRVDNITEEVVVGNIEKFKHLMSDDCVGDLFRKYRIEHMDLDDVLDKISAFGVCSLDEIDKNILRKG